MAKCKSLQVLNLARNTFLVALYVRKLFIVKNTRNNTQLENFEILVQKGDYLYQGSHTVTYSSSIHSNNTLYIFNCIFSANTGYLSAPKIFTESSVSASDSLLAVF